MDFLVLRQIQNSIKLKQIKPVLQRMTSSKSSFESPKKEIDSSVPGLSSKVLNITSQEVGPGASKNSNYKNPEYFSYHKTSYFDAELEMLKYRLPQPTNKLST